MWKHPQGFAEGSALVHCMHLYAAAELSAEGPEMEVCMHVLCHIQRGP
jgi:hypothetical protein